jgi:hypothetical protein
MIMRASLPQHSIEIKHGMIAGQLSNANRAHRSMFDIFKSKRKRAVENAVAFITKMVEPHGTIPPAALSDAYCLGSNGWRVRCFRGDG